MLLVQTRLGESVLHGLGLFAAEPIGAGTLVSRFESGFDLEMPRAEVDALPDFQLAFFRRFAYAAWLDPSRVRCALDNARFLNHADAPNLVIDGDRTFAARDIAAGEELTHDYRALSPEPPFDPAGKA